MGHFSGYGRRARTGDDPSPDRRPDDRGIAAPGPRPDARGRLRARPAALAGDEPIIYSAAQSAILTGVLLGVARIAGETAPLLFTALNNQFWSASLNEPLANVPVVIFQYAMSPYDEWHALAWAGAFVLTAFVLVLNICVRFLARKGGNNDERHRRRASGSKPPRRRMQSRAT